MNKFVKSLLAIGVTSACHISIAQAATYKIIDKGDVPTLKYTYSQQENNNGEMAISGTNSYNLPVQFQYFDEDDFDDLVDYADARYENVFELNNIEDEDALRAGNPNANDLSWAIRFLNSKRGQTLYQELGDVIAMTNINGQTEEVVIFDEVFEGTDILTRSTSDYINGITNDGWIYGNGSAPYIPIDFTESDGDEVTHWVREFTTRGFFSPDYGQTIVPLLPPESRFGGESAILDISDSRIAVGYASTSIDQDAIDIITDTSGGCADEDVLDDLPFAACVQEVLTRINDDAYNTEAFKWFIDANGEVNTEALGYLVELNEDDESENTSVAQAVNIHGVTVGYAIGWWDEKETDPSENERRQIYAVVFKDGIVRDFTEDHSEYFDSRAYDINDNGIAVGHVRTYVNGNLRKKFYHVDTNDFDNMEMKLPEDFFSGSSSSARAINENNIIVGDGEVETHNDSSQNPRRTHGFMYDITAGVFTDLNDFLPCDSEYTIVEARDINDNNEISATAIVKVPRRDSKGNIKLDENGEVRYEDVVRAVKMAPIDGEIEDCSEIEEKIEREGAGIGVVPFIALVLMGLRRRFFAK